MELLIVLRRHTWEKVHKCRKNNVSIHLTLVFENKTFITPSIAYLHKHASA